MSEKKVTGATPAKKPATTQQNRDGTIGCIVLVVLAVLAFTMLKSCVGGSSSKSDEEVEARIQCEDAIKSKLKTPSTAKVHRGDLRRDANDTIIITGTVDSDNSFGARLTMSYRCATVNGVTEASVSE